MEPLIPPYEPPSQGTWLRRRGWDEPAGHVCRPPRLALAVDVHAVGDEPDDRPAVAADLGDRWRCACGQPWRVENACDACPPVRPDGPGHGGHAAGLTWRRHRTLFEWLVRP